MRVLSCILFCLILVLAMGCQTNPLEEQPSTAVPVPTTEGGTTPMSPTLEIPVDASIQRLIDLAMADLAARLSITTSEITLLDATPMVWSDSSLGCPQPGMAYLQVPEDGLLIRLEVNGQIYPYHSGGNRDPFLCEIVQKDTGRPPQIDLLTLTPFGPDTSSTPDNGIPPGEDS
jgi:hypothetical protein